MARMTRRLPCALTAAELDARRDALVSSLEQKERIVAQKKELTSELSQQAKDLDAEVRKIAREIARKEEERDVEVREHLDDKTFTVSWIRQDTLEVVEERAMTEDEVARARQGTLPGVDGGGRKGRRRKGGEEPAAAEASPHDQAEQAPTEAAPAAPAPAPMCSRCEPHNEHPDGRCGVDDCACLYSTTAAPDTVETAAPGPGPEPEPTPEPRRRGRRPRNPAPAPEDPVLPADETTADVAELH